MNTERYRFAPPHVSLMPWPALLTFFCPLFVCFIIYNLFVGCLIPDGSWDLAPEIKPNTQAFDQLARDAAGRLQIGIASAVLRIAAAVAFLFASDVLARRIGVGWTLVLITLSLLATAIVLYTHPHAGAGKIITAIEQVRAATHGGTAFGVVERAIRWNIVASLIGGTSIMAVFAAVALDTPPHTDRVIQLRSRSRDLERATLLGAAFLVALTALNKTLIDWPQAFLDEHQRQAFASFAGAIATYWGTFGALTLISSLVPAYIFLNHEIGEAARPTVNSLQQTPEDWRKANGLEFDSKSGLGAALAALAPILTVPGMDLASKLLH